MKNNYYDIIGWHHYPQWAKNRITYQEDVNIINMLIKENQTWMDYHGDLRTTCTHSIRGNIQNVVMHKERIELLKKNLADLKNNLQII